MEESSQNVSPQLPFQNLFLISGLVNGWNKVWMYVGTLMFMVTGYILYQFVVFFPLLNRLTENGYSREQIEANPNLLFDPAALGMDKNLVLGLELGMFVFAFLGFLLGIRFFHRKSLVSICTSREIPIPGKSGFQVKSEGYKR